MLHIYVWYNRYIMKKIVLALLTFWMAFGHVAYASAQLECASMMNSSMQQEPSSEMDAKHDCCKPNPCQCQIKTRTTDQSVALVPRLTFERSVSQLALPTAFSNPSLSGDKNFIAPSLKSPPKNFHALHAVLRI